MSIVAHPAAASPSSFAVEPAFVANPAPVARFNARIDAVVATLAGRPAVVVLMGFGLAEARVAANRPDSLSTLWSRPTAARRMNPRLPAYRCLGPRSSPLNWHFRRSRSVRRSSSSTRAPCAAASAPTPTDFQPLKFFKDPDRSMEFEEVSQGVVAGYAVAWV